MKYHSISFTLHALGPIAHASMDSDTGNVTRFRRIPCIGVDGLPLYVPALSAGAIRGCVRRLLWRQIFEDLDISRETIPDTWDRLYAALANGGTIEKAENRIDPEDIRTRRARMPVLSMLGAALYESYMAGSIKVTNAWLGCAEAHAAGLPVPKAGPMRDRLAEETRVRHVDREWQSPEASNVGPMPTTCETVIAGSTFHGRAAGFIELDLSAWAYGLDLITHIGGKGSAGFGEVRVDHTGDPKPFAEWLEANREPHREALIQLASELKRSKKK